jgi:hypothetical protein
MKTKLLLAAVAALSLGATGAQAVPATTATDIVTFSANLAIAPAHDHAGQFPGPGPYQRAYFCHRFKFKACLVHP